MNPLPIQQWNPIIGEYGEVKSSFYISPTLKTLQFLNRDVGNGNRLALVRVRNSGHPLYDDREVFATVDTSAFPNYRENFYRTTKFLIVTLTINWSGYPPSKGTVEFLEGIVAPEVDIAENYEEISAPSPSHVVRATTAPLSSDAAPSAILGSISTIQTPRPTRRSNLSQGTMQMIALSLLVMCIVSVCVRN